MKHIKEFYNFENINESLLGTLQLFAIGFFLHRFIKSIINKKNKNNSDKKTHLQIEDLLEYLKNENKIPVVNLNDRYFIRITSDSGELIDIRIMKDNKLFKIDTSKGSSSIQLSDDEYEQFLNLIKK